MTTVDELVVIGLRHECQKQTHRSIRQIGLSKETDLTQCSIVQITHCVFFVRSVFCLPTRLLPIIVSFLFTFIFYKVVYISTQLKCGKILKNHFIANLSTELHH